MTKLVEYQVKEILRDEGIATPPGVLCRTAAEARAAAEDIGTKVYIKAQIAAGDRATAGGIRSVNGPLEAETVAREMLDMKIQGIPVDAVLVEGAVKAEWEGYASVSIVEGPPRRVLRFSRSGGTGFDPAKAPFQLEFSSVIEPYAIRRELRRIGFTSSDLVTVSRTLTAIAQCAVKWSAYTLELNPIAFTSDGIVALDGKADIDDYSKDHLPNPSYLEVVESDPRERFARDFQARDHRGSFRYVQLVGEDASPEDGRPWVASHSVGGGESMVVLDALDAAGLVPTNYCDTSGSPSVEKVTAASALVAAQPHIQGIFFSTCIANQPLTVTARGLVAGWESAGWSGPTVVRLAGNEASEAQDIVRSWGADRLQHLVVVGEETDEWAAAEILRDLIRNVNQEKVQ